MKMELEFLGGCREVGKIAIIARQGKNSVCMDYGMMAGHKCDDANLQGQKGHRIFHGRHDNSRGFFENDDNVPLVPEYEPDAVVLSHGHLDHVGACPILYKGKWNPHLMCNDVTFDMTKLLVEDAMRIAKKEGRDIAFGKDEYRKMKAAKKTVDFYDKVKFGGLDVCLYPSGHIPGSAGIMVNGKKRIFYSSDFKLSDTRLMKAGTVPKNVHTLIMESTYSEREHSHRQDEEKKLIEMVEEAVGNRQHILIPVFAVGRAQEILLVLEKFADKIAFDGMARKASIIVNRYARYLRDPERLGRILKRIKWVEDEKDRLTVLKRYPIIVTTAGMAGGGPIVYYLKKLSSRDCRLVFVGYLPEGTAARQVLDTRIFKTSTEEFKVKSRISQLDFSAHAGRRELFEMVRKTIPRQVICVHGDRCHEFAKEIEEHIGVDAYAPKNGEVVEV